MVYGKVVVILGVLAGWAWMVGACPGGLSWGPRGSHPREGQGTCAGSWVPGEPLGLGGGVGGPTQNIPQPWVQFWRGLENEDHIR